MAGNFCRSPIHLLFSIRASSRVCPYRVWWQSDVGYTHCSCWDASFPCWGYEYLAGEVCSEQHRQRNVSLPTYLIERPAAHSGAAMLSLATSIRFPIPLSQSHLPYSTSKWKPFSRTHSLTHSLTPFPPSYKSPSPPARTSPYTLYPPAATPAYQSNTPHHSPDPLSKTD